MKILFLSAANSIHTVRWVNALAERGNEVTLVSKADHHADHENIISEKVKVIYLPVKGMKGYYLNALTLKKICTKVGADVINVHYASGYGTLARIARLPHIVLSVWGSDVYDFPYESQLKKYILVKNLKYAAVIASTSQVMANQTGKFLKENKDIYITPFGVDIQQFAPEAVIKKDAEETVFGIVKSLSPKYGIGMIIWAFTVLVNRLTDEEKKRVRLEIYGKGEQEAELKALTEKLHMEEKVFFRGWVPNNQVPDILRGLDIFVLGSERESESFGVAAVEAMACGIPVVATSVSGFREVIENGVTGFLVPVRDTDAMARRMMELYRDRGLRKRLGDQGRRRVERLYDWDSCVDRMLECYKKGLRKRN